MVGRNRVLVVDGLSETEEVLKAVLEPRGLQVDRVRGDAELAESQRAPAPRLVVLHATRRNTPTRQASDWNGVPRVVIGTQRGKAIHDSSCAASDHYLCEPFHYGELIDAINRLLNAG